MSTATTTTRTAAGTSARRESTTTGRGWAYTGALAGFTGLAGIIASGTVNAVYDKKVAGDPEAIVDKLADQTPNLLVFHSTTMIAAVLLVVFAAGLRRRLGAQTRAGSLLPDVAAGGLLLAAMAGVMGAGLDTEFLSGVNLAKDDLVPETAVFYGHWIGTIPWLWFGAGLAGVSVAVAAFKQAAAPRWLGWVGAVLGGLTLLTGISPMEYLSGFTGTLMVLILGIGFARGDRDELT